MNDLREILTDQLEAFGSFYLSDTWVYREHPLFKEPTGDQESTSSVMHTPKLSFDGYNNSDMVLAVKCLVASRIESGRCSLTTAANYASCYRFVLEAGDAVSGITIAKMIHDPKDCLVAFEHYSAHATKTAGRLHVYRSYPTIRGIRKHSYQSFATSVFKQILHNLRTMDGMPERDDDLWNLLDHGMSAESINVGRPRTNVNFSAVPEKLGMRDYIKDYVESHCDSLTQNTLAHHIREFAKFGEYLLSQPCEVAALSDVTVEVVDGFYGSILADEPRAKSNRRHAGHIMEGVRVIFRYLEIVNKWTQDPPVSSFFERISFPDLHTSEPCPLSQGEQKRFELLLAALATHNPLHANMARLMTRTGLRPSDICGLQISSLAYEKGGLAHFDVVQFKTPNQPLVVLLDAEMTELVSGQIQVTRDKHGAGARYVFLSRTGAPVTEESLSSSLKMEAIKSQILNDKGRALMPNFRQIRQTVATNAVRDGKDASVVNRNILGHSSERGLDYYVLNDPQALNRNQDKMMDVLQKRLVHYAITVCSSSAISGSATSRQSCQADDGIPVLLGRCQRPVEAGMCDHALFCAGCSCYAADLKYQAVFETELEKTKVAQRHACDRGESRYVALLEKRVQALEATIEGIRKRLAEDNVAIATGSEDATTGAVGPEEDVG